MGVGLREGEEKGVEDGRREKGQLGVKGGLGRAGQEGEGERLKFLTPSHWLCFPFSE